MGLTLCCLRWLCISMNHYKGISWHICNITRGYSASYKHHASAQKFLTTIRAKQSLLGANQHCFLAHPYQGLVTRGIDTALPTVARRSQLIPCMLSFIASAKPRLLSLLRVPHSLSPLAVSLASELWLACSALWRSSRLTNLFPEEDSPVEVDAVVCCWARSDSKRGFIVWMTGMRLRSWSASLSGSEPLTTNNEYPVTKNYTNFQKAPFQPTTLVSTKLCYFVSFIVVKLFNPNYCVCWMWVMLLTGWIGHKKK